MNQPRNCPRCGAALPADALQGLCPVCLLRQGATADTATQGEEASVEPLAVEEVARLFPQLEVLALLGKGGMGSVYQARQPALDRYVALKILPQRAGGQATFGDRFQREARALARLAHPNIVAVYDFGQTEGVPWLLMEYVDGVNLRQLQRNRRLAPREALQLVPQICDALQYAHDEGIVHRDIKPENVLVDRKGRVKIADFGLARMLGAEGPDLRLTGEGQIMGTPHYMAPEQVEHPLEVDHRADIYALGVVFYELLTGELPLGKFPPPSRRVQVDVRLDEVVLRALEKEPARRYQHASEVKSDVETIAGSPEKAAAIGGESGLSRSAAPASGIRVASASRLSEPERRRRAMLWYGFIVSAIGIPAGLALDLPLVWALGLVGVAIASHKLGWWRWRQGRGVGKLGAAWLRLPSSVAAGSRASEATPTRAVPLILWPALGTLGIAAIVKFLNGLEGIPTAIGDLLLLLGLAARWRVAWAATLFFALFGSVWALVVAVVAADLAFAMGVLLVNGLVAASVWFSASWFFPGPPEGVARRRKEAVLGLVFLLLPGSFLAALLGDVFGLDIDAQFYAAMIGLPLVTGLAGLLVWGLMQFAGEDRGSGNEPRRWCWQAIVGVIVLGLNLPLFATGLLIVRTIAKDPSWNPAPAEAGFTFGIVGGSLVLTLTCILLGIGARRGCGAEAPSRRGGRLAWACIWLWPVLLVSAFSVQTERVDPSAAVTREGLAVTSKRLEIEILARAALLGVPLDRVQVVLGESPASAVAFSTAGKLAGGVEGAPGRFPLRLTPGEFGRWQVRGEAELEGLRFWVAGDSSDPVSRPSAPRPGFMPTLTAVLSATGREILRDAFLDLETGRVLSAPEALAAKLRAAGRLPSAGPWQIQPGPLHDWMREQGVDLVLRPGHSGLTLLDGVSVLTGAGHVEGAPFDAQDAASVAALSMNLAETLKLHEELHPGEPVFTWLEPKDDYRTWLFRNRAGTAGLIEVTRTAREGREVWVRWKLLRDAPAERSRPEPPGVP